MEKKELDNELDNGLDTGLEMMDINHIDEKKEDSKKKKKSRKKTKFDYIRYTVMGIAAIVFVFAAYNLWSIYDEYSKGEETYEDALDSFITDTDVTLAAVTGDVVSSVKEFKKLSIDFEQVQKVNPHIIGWIQFEGISTINYPILRHPEQSNYYLRRMYNHEHNTAGSIFVGIENGKNFTDYNTFVYGHNMKNLSMFGRLKKYKEESFYKGKEFFWIYTPEANYRYQIFSIHEVKVDTGNFRVFKEKGESFTEYVKDAKEKSMYDTGVEVTGNERIISLSTCTSRGDDWRLLVQAKLIGVETK